MEIKEFGDGGGGGGMGRDNERMGMEEGTCMEERNGEGE